MSLQKIHSSVNDCISTLKSLDVETESWDPILIYLISTKLPDETISLWEQSLESHRDLPKWSQMDKFLINRFEIVERISSIRSTKEYHKQPSIGSSPHFNKIQTFASQEKLDEFCPVCKDRHNIRICPEFRRFTTQERIDFVFKNKICNNCLSQNHIKTKCKSKKTCISCKKQHHTLLHLKQEAISTPSNQFKPNAQKNSNISNNSAIKSNAISPSSSKETYSQVQANFSSNNETILLRTALVQIESNGELFTIRALLDPGSQRTFLSERIRNVLRIPYRKSHFEIIGIGGSSQKAEKECELFLHSKRHNLRFPINAIVLPKLTRKLPSVSFDISLSPELQEIDLADPNFNKSSNIDLILGNDTERFINIDGIIKNVCGQASAYNTIFGWVLSGPMRRETVHSFTTNVIQDENDSLNTMLRKFWEAEEIPSIALESPEDIYCEDFYAKTTIRRPDGRYVVRLPFKHNFQNTIFLGSSRFLALGQYTRLDKTLTKDNDLREEYSSVLNEYIDLSHMEECSSQEICEDGKYTSYYLPHHAVVRPNHKTTKVRVVFNASRKTKSGFSLNDVLYKGPTLQTDLISTILNWRKYKYVFSADIQKMYRQIIIHPQDRDFQRILFQKYPTDPIKDYQLNTVTFGVNCAPFLAIRTILQLASDCEKQYPQVALTLRKETYVDDILSGGFSISETIESQINLISVLKSAGFPLKKFTANDPQLLSHLNSDDLYDLDLLRFGESNSTKTLGIKWNALKDCFSYSSENLKQQVNATKRQVLSIVAQMFDPVGWISPVVIRAKILMQQIWLENSGWDDSISNESLHIWNNLLSDFSLIETITIPRWIQYMPSDNIEIHGFCDSSKMAYCACLYIRCQTSKNTVFSNLLIAKSKVAPLKPLSLPKLELNGALLLARLTKYALNVFNFDVRSLTLWTDASIVLGWLSKPPWSWETYVANRTSLIRDLAPNAKWKYVPTHYNPADLGTRGCKPQDLACNPLWWNGPPWLILPESNWPKRNPLSSLEPKENLNIINTLSTENTVEAHHGTVEEIDILSRFSSYSRALRVISYVFRFYYNTLHRFRNIHQFSAIDLTLKEIKFIKNRLIHLTQRRYYATEYNALLSSECISTKSVLLTLNPFLDSDNIMRVNGRLSDSFLPYKERYPIILPGNSKLCQLYLSHLHIFLAHGECNQMCRLVQTEFFVSRLKPRVKGIIHRCKICILHKQRPSHQIMAPLPPERCTFTPPFHVTGVDFAGPFELKSSTLRKSTILKGYVSVFVCFSTKAIHLEPCSDLSSLAFEAAFSRFVGRRGLPHRMVSDNGKNFIGAEIYCENFHNF